MTQLLKDKYCFGHIISLLEYFATKEANCNKITDVCTKCGKVCQDKDFLVLHMITDHEAMGLPDKDMIIEKEPGDVVKEK